jgi:hypothetical protein
MVVCENPRPRRKLPAANRLNRSKNDKTPVYHEKFSLSFRLISLPFLFT